MNNMSLSFMSRISDESIIYLANCYTSSQIALIAGLPQSEVVGLKIKQVEFGLNVNEEIIRNSDNLISIGKLIQSGTEVNKEITLNKNDFY